MVRISISNYPGYTLMNRSTTILLTRLLCLMIFSIAVTCNMAIAKTRLPTLELMAESCRFEVEIAETPALRELGLMNRHALPDNHGMLFVFPETYCHCLWMHNTKIPMSAAFIDEQGIIVNIADMQPNTDDKHCASSSVHYVIEMRSGWFLEKGIGPGSLIKGLDKAPLGR